MGETVRVLLADDHPVYRDGLAALLGSLDGVEVVGTAADGVEAVDGARGVAAGCRGDGCADAASWTGSRRPGAITADSPHIGVVVLTMAEEDQTLFAAMRAGARGYLLKGANQAEIVRAITAVAQGEAIFGPAIARRVAEFFSAAPAASTR